MQLRKAIRGAVRKATRRMVVVRKATRRMAGVRRATRVRLAPQGRRLGRPRDTLITQHRPTRLLRDMDRTAPHAATQEETAAEGIRQLRATARVAAMDRPRRTLPAATALLVPIRRRAPIVAEAEAIAAVVAEAIAAEAAAVDRALPVAVVAIPVAAAIDNSV
jgi:hypothetical protein